MGNMLKIATCFHPVEMAVRSQKHSVRQNYFYCDISLSNFDSLKTQSL